MERQFPLKSFLLALSICSVGLGFQAYYISNQVTHQKNKQFSSHISQVSMNSYYDNFRDLASGEEKSKKVENVEDFKNQAEKLKSQTLKVREKIRKFTTEMEKEISSKKVSEIDDKIKKINDNVLKKFNEDFSILSEFADNYSSKEEDVSEQELQDEMDKLSKLLTDAISDKKTLTDKISSAYDRALTRELKKKNEKIDELNEGICKQQNALEGMRKEVLGSISKIKQTLNESVYQGFNRQSFGSPYLSYPQNMYWNAPQSGHSLGFENLIPQMSFSNMSHHFPSMMNSNPYSTVHNHFYGQAQEAFQFSSNNYDGWNNISFGKDQGNSFRRPGQASFNFQEQARRQQEIPQVQRRSQSQDQQGAFFKF